MQTIRIERDGRGVATLWLARAQKHNAMSGEMIGELAEAATALAADSSVRVVVLAGEGTTYCAGGDLGWMRDQFTATAEERRAEAARLAAMLGAFDALPKPLIGRVQGNAFGGGLGLIAVCDAVIAVEDARFAFTEVKLGLIPATIGPYVLARMTPGAARRYFFSARPFGGIEAQAAGLVAQVVTAEELDASVEAEIAPWLAAAPGAVAAAKALLRRLNRAPSTAEVADSITALVERWESAEAQAGIAAFFERRPQP